MASSGSTETQVAIVDHSFPWIALPRVLLSVLELLLMFFIVLPTQLNLSLSLFLPLLDSCKSILFSLLAILFLLKHFFMKLLLHLLLLITNLLNLYFFLLSQIIVFRLRHLHSTHGWLELLLSLFGHWKLNLFSFC